jgi:5-methyltetrahydrofolate--homocysteine methyltransferase
MKIIGEKINGTRKQVAAAISTRDVDSIRSLAIQQAQAGAHWLDVNAGTHPEREPEDLTWLVQTVQDAVELPLCLDSTNPKALVAGLKEVKRTPLINSISGEPGRLNDILPLAVEHGCEVIALAMDDRGIPATADARLEVIRRIFEATRRAGMRDSNVYIDPLVMTVATNIEAARVTLDVIRATRAAFPDAHVSLGLSNVSFGLPARALINRTFLALALAAGADTALVDPMDRELMASLMATELLLGQDKHCLRYIRAFRAGLLGTTKRAVDTKPSGQASNLI